MQDFVEMTNISSPSGLMVIKIVHHILINFSEELPNCYKNIIANICKSTSYFQNFSYIQCFKTTSHIILRFLIPSGFCLQFVIILTPFSISNWFPLFRGAISQKINYKLPYYWLISVFWCDYLNFWVNLSNSFTICHRTDIFQYFNLLPSWSVYSCSINNSKMYSNYW